MYPSVSPKASILPIENNPMMNDINTVDDTRMIITPINLPKTLKIDVIILPNVSRKSWKPDLALGLYFFSAFENLSETFFAPSLIFSFTELNSSLIFFSILLIFTGSPSICNFSAVVLASGNNTHRMI